MTERYMVTTHDRDSIETDKQGAFEAAKAMKDRTVWTHPKGVIAGAAIRRVEPLAEYNRRNGIGWGESSQKALQAPDEPPVSEETRKRTKDQVQKAIAANRTS